jgi:uncharacterized protein YbjT (DUF2867 family)
MVIGVLGGTGTAGREVTAELRRRGHEAIVLSRSAPADGRSRAVDVTADVSVAAAMLGVDAVVDVISGKSDVMVDGVARALRAARRGGATHWVSLSVVGAGELPFGYHRLMGEREAVTRAGEVPWSIVRATQFHTLLGMAFGAAARRGVLPLLDVPIQPVEVREVAVALADRVEAGPSRTAEDFAGPRVERLDELATAWTAAHGMHRLPLRIPAIGKAMRAVRAGGLTSPDAPRGTVTFADWLRAETRSAVPAGHEEAAGWA